MIIFNFPYYQTENVLPITCRFTDTFPDKIIIAVNILTPSDWIHNNRGNCKRFKENKSLWGWKWLNCTCNYRIFILSTIITLCFVSAMKLYWTEIIKVFDVNLSYLFNIAWLEAANLSWQKIRFSFQSMACWLYSNWIDLFYFRSLPS